jgi:putative DNA-invertase from lambdoid prophage Rac
MQMPGSKKNFCNFSKVGVLLLSTKTHNGVKAMPAYIYTRVSTVDQGENTSLTEQARKAAAVASYHGLDPVHTVQEIGVSGGLPFAERPAGKELMAKMVKGDTLIVAKLDRAFRNAEDALTTSRVLQNAGISLIIADIGTDPVTGNGVGKLFFTMLAALAEFERERIAERMAEGRAAKKKANGYTGGMRKFGYKIVGEGRNSYLIEDPKEQAAIARIKELGAQDHSLRDIAGIVNREFKTNISHMIVSKIINPKGA